MASEKITLRLCAQLEYRPLAMDLVSALIAHVPGADRTFLNEMITAFGEAFNNVVAHSYRGRSDGMIEVHAELGADHLTLRVVDDGLSSDASLRRPLELERLPEAGMGMFIMHAMVDEVAYRGGTPNVLTLTKKVGTRP